MNAESVNAYRKWPSLALLSYLSFLGLGCALLLSIRTIQLPLILSLIFYFVLSPVVDWLGRRGFGREVSIAVVYLIMGFSFFLLFWLLSPLVMESYKKLVIEFPHAMSRLQRAGESFLLRFGDHIPATLREDTWQQLFSYLQDTLMLLLKSLPSMIPNLITTLILIPVFGFFFIRDGNTIQKKLLSPVPNRYFEISLKLLNLIKKKVGDYIRGRLLESFVVGSCIGFGLFLMDVKYFFFHAVFAAILNLIPFIGPVVAAVPAVVLALMEFQGWGHVTLVISLFAGVQLLDAAVFVSAVLAKAIDLHPVWVIAAIFAGGQVYGVVGMIIGVPIVSILKIILEESVREMR